MSDDDLIRRGDARVAVFKCHAGEWEVYGWGKIHERIASLPAVTQPAPDAAAIREAWEKAYWQMRSYAVHDNDCKRNKPPRFEGPCSCGLTDALKQALAALRAGGAL